MEMSDFVHCHAWATDTRFTSEILTLGHQLAGDYNCAGARSRNKKWM